MRRDIQFLFGQHIPQCTHRISKYFKDYYVLQFMDGGIVTLQIGEETHRMEGRYFWSSYPGPKISFQPAIAGSSWVHRYLAFRGPKAQEWFRKGIFPIPPQRIAAGLEFADRFDELLELARQEVHWKKARATLLLEMILTELAEARAKPSQLPAWLEEGMKLLTDLNRKIDIDELAAQANMSVRTYRRKFMSATGSSPRAYAIRYRLNHARQLLGASDLPIKAIATKLGYRDVFFFTRQFSRATGMSPGAYRKTRYA